MASFQLFGGTNPARVAHGDSVAVIGLGRFGQSLALELMELGAEVLGIDSREDVVQELNGQLTHVVRADATSESVLRQLSIQDFSRVVVAIGSDIQASILVTSQLLKFDVPNIWAKAVTDAHGTILDQLGVKNVINPEKDMGKRVAHLVRGSMKDYIQIADGYSLVTTACRMDLAGLTVHEVLKKAPTNVQIVALINPDTGWSFASSGTVLHQEDTLVIIGPTDLVEAFASRPHTRE